MIIGSLIVVLADVIVSLIKACSMSKRSARVLEWVMVTYIMMETKVGSLKCQVIQVDGSGIDITIHEVKYAGY